MLKCDLHDYVEIMCMYQYLVRLNLKNGLVIQGQFHDTGFEFNDLEPLEKSVKQEVIIGKDINMQPLTIFTHTIASIDVLTKNAKFTHIAF